MPPVRARWRETWAFRPIAASSELEHAPILVDKKEFSAQFIHRFSTFSAELLSKVSDGGFRRRDQLASPVLECEASDAISANWRDLFTSSRSSAEVPYLASEAGACG